LIAYSRSLIYQEHFVAERERERERERGRERERERERQRERERESTGEASMSARFVAIT
jgi:hypothetical protein